MDDVTSARSVSYERWSTIEFQSVLRTPARTNMKSKSLHHRHTFHAFFGGVDFHPLYLDR